MGEWEPLHLHWSFKGEHVLVPYIVLKGLPSFFFAALLIICICVSERIITSYLDAGYPLELSSSRWRTALRRGFLFWIAVVLRLFYMLIAMTFNLGLILTIATTLSLTQFILELRTKPRSNLHTAHDYTSASQVDIHDEDDAFLSIRRSSGGGGRSHQVSSASTFVALESVSTSTTPKPRTVARPRSKSKPDDIFIHPAESNIARADVLALQLGISKSDAAERVQSEPTAKWEVGKGPDLARELLSRPPANVSARRGGGNVSATHQRTGSFQIGSSSSESGLDTDNDDDDGHSEMKKLVR